MIEKCVWGINHEPLLKKYARGLDHKMGTDILKEIREHLADCEECRSFVADNDEPFEHNPRDSEYDSEEGQAFREIANKEFVVDWVNREMREMESVHDESLDHKIQSYHDALKLYESGDDTKLVELLEEDRADAERRLDMPNDAYAAEFGQTAADITNEGIQREIDTIDSLLGFLRG